MTNELITRDYLEKLLNASDAELVAISAMAVLPVSTRLNRIVAQNNLPGGSGLYLGKVCHDLSVNGLLTNDQEIESDYHLDADVRRVMLESITFADYDGLLNQLLRGYRIIVQPDDRTYALINYIRVLMLNFLEPAMSPHTDSTVNKVLGLDKKILENDFTDAERGFMDSTTLKILQNLLANDN